MRCQEFQEMMDSYLSDELLVETNHEVLHHLENCPACRNELAARRELLAYLRSAVKHAPDARLNTAFARRLENRLRETALRLTVWGQLKDGVLANSSIFAATAAACLLFAVLFGAVWFYRSLLAENTAAIQPNRTDKTAEFARPTELPASQAVKIASRQMRETALGDHKNCAVHFRLTEEPITLTEAAAKYGRFNKDLDKAVIAAARRAAAEKLQSKTVGEIKLLEAHSCIFNNRRFAHVVLRRGKKIISVLVTDTENSFDENDATITNQTDRNLQVAGFHTVHHAVFVISDLSEAENLTIAETLIPAVRRHIEESEA